MNATASKSVFTQLGPLLPFWVQQMPTWQLVLAGVVGFPVLAIALNVFWQLAIPRPKSAPPLVFHWIPWFGSAAYYGESPYEFFFENRAKYGDVFEFVLLGRRVTVALGPKGNNLSLGGKVSQVSAEDAYTHLTTPVFGKGVVFDCPNDMLMQQKKFIKHGLTTEALQSYAPLMWAEAEQFFATELNLASPTSKPVTVELFKRMSELIILTASRTLQGKEVRQGLNSRFAQLFHDLDGGFIPINFMFTNLPLPANVKRDRAQKEMSDFYRSIIEKRRTGEATTDEHDMIAALTGCAYKNGVPLTDTDISHMMIAILMAGQHTSSATSSWTLLHIAERQDIQEALWEEQKKVLGQADGTLREPTYEDTKDMPLMDSCIRETLRMHAPIHSIYRKVKSAIPVPSSLSAPSETDSYVIPAGNFIMAAPGVSAMDPLIWDEPSKWKPSRWQEEGGVAAAATRTYDGDAGETVDYGYGQVSKGTESPYQPFGAGRHRCVGESFAYLQLSVLISYIVRNYQLKLATPEFPKTNYRTMIVLPLKGMVTFERRKACV